jgi:hypothetical protein
MESKVTRALLVRAYMAHHSWVRHRFISTGEFEEAMTQQFFYEQYCDELDELENKMTSKEYFAYLRASHCTD